MFFARDLVGGDSFSWDDTPLKVLNENFVAIDTASQALGKLLYEVLDEDIYKFEINQEHDSKYRLVE